VDYTGTGNTLNVRHPHVLQLLMDSLRYWVSDMHVDGFRFDLAATLARTLHEVDRLSAFFDIIQQDPVISQVKLIAEPWDVGEGGYQVGNFPPLWSEWNGTYRDCVRDYWRGRDQTLPELASRLTGSSDLYEHTGRKPWASINFVTCHDGFTLRDLVSYENKQNDANLEDNRDGTDDNRSWNCGTEGPTDDREINRVRRRQQRNFFVTLLLSQGVPMMLAGDEIGHTQWGNNNAYCQDNETSWLDWEHVDRDLLGFVRRLGALRHRHPVFHRRRWFQGKPLHGAGASDIAWFTPTGEEMSESDWSMSYARCVGVFLNGDVAESGEQHSDLSVDSSFFLILNAFWEQIDFVVPDGRFAQGWTPMIDTARETDPFFDDPGSGVALEPGDHLTVEGRSAVLLGHRRLLDDAR
jgi:glycogen operon protein